MLNVNKSNIRSARQKCWSVNPPSTTKGGTLHPPPQIFSPPQTHDIRNNGLLLLFISGVRPFTNIHLVPDHVQSLKTKQIFFFNRNPPCPPNVFTACVQCMSTSCNYDFLKYTFFPFVVVPYLKLNNKSSSLFCTFICRGHFDSVRQSMRKFDLVQISSNLSISLSIGWNRFSLSACGHDYHTTDVHDIEAINWPIVFRLAILH